MKKPRVTTIVFAMLGIAVGLTVWGWMRIPHNQLDVEGPLRGQVRALPADRVIGKPVIDFTIPGVGRIALPKPEPASAADVTYLKKHSAAGGFLRARSKPIFKEIMWDIDGRIYSYGDFYDMYDRLAVPYVFGDHSRKVRLRVNPRDGWIGVTLPALYRPAPTIPAKTVQVGRLKVEFKPLPVLTTLPYVDYDVSVTGGEPGQRFALAFTQESNDWYRPSPFHLGDSFRLRVSLPAKGVRFAIAPAFSNAIELKVWKDPHGANVIGRTPGGEKFFACDKDGCRIENADALGPFRLEMKGEREQYDGGIGRGMIDMSSNQSSFDDAAFLRRYRNGEVVLATLYTVGTRREYSVDLAIPDQAQFLIER